MSAKKNKDKEASPGCMLSICFFIIYIVVATIYEIPADSWLNIAIIPGLLLFTLIFDHFFVAHSKANNPKPHVLPASTPRVHTLAGSMAALFRKIERNPGVQKAIAENTIGLEPLSAVTDNAVTGFSKPILLLYFSDFMKVSDCLRCLECQEPSHKTIITNALWQLYEPIFNQSNKEIEPETIDQIYDAISLIRNSATSPYTFNCRNVLSHLNLQQDEAEFMTLLQSFAEILIESKSVVTAKDRQYLAGLAKLTAKLCHKEDSHAPAPEQENDPASSNAIERLSQLTGLPEVKSEIQQLVSFIKMQQLRQQKGMKTAPVSLHCVFTGNPGTGKTTVARIIADVYRELGILKKGHLVETDRAGLVAEYVGQTAVKTNKVIDSALDGVLFIDEAYSLVPHNAANDYGPEAIATLLKRMEDNRNRLVVILAGYGDEMQRFIESNPGLKSRFNRYIHFTDYSPAELSEIFRRMASEADYILSAEADARLCELTEQLVAGKDRHFGNARTMRNLFEKAIQRQASRLADAEARTLSADALRTLTPADLQEPVR